MSVFNCCFTCRDEDMQSVASLMSIGKTDIGNLDELEEEGENSGDHSGDHSFCSRLAEITTQLSNLDEEDESAGNPFGNPFGDPDLECDGFECGILL